MENVLYFELSTEYGPLYIYEKYLGNPKFSHEIPETREFFTHEKARVGYDRLCFLNDSIFTVRERNMEGLITAEYKRELSPYEFLEKVGAFLETDEKLAEKRKKIYGIFEMKANKIGNTNIIVEEPLATEDQKNRIATKILTRYISR